MTKIIAYVLAYLLRLKFYLRKFDIGYDPSDLVLDVGSGNDPHPRADILIDFKREDVDRPFKLARDSRPFLYASAEALPFKDKVIDFVICSHVLEHVDNPAKAIDEMTRVAKKGYIETPSEISQKICDMPSHKWFVRRQGNELDFTRKKEPFYNEDIANIFFQLYNEKNPYYMIWSYSFKQGLIRHRWKDKIDYKIFDFPQNEINKNKFDLAIKQNIDNIPRYADKGFRVFIKNMIMRYYGLITSRRKRLKGI